MSNTPNLFDIITNVIYATDEGIYYKEIDNEHIDYVIVKKIYSLDQLEELRKKYKQKGEYISQQNTGTWLYAFKIIENVRHTLNSNLGERIRKLRKFRKISQEKLAFFIGINRNTLSKYETNKIKNPDLKILKKIAAELSCPIEYLLNQ